ncbi:long-chain-fatty-acid--CoA ligase [Tistrella bauzanensis]|uniref:long-chain-fatty-acid--CoA ligase n=1 Tax=Tistrella TaxID=171436 RepID=UPI0031F687EF
MYLTQSLHRDMLTRPDDIATITGDRRRTVRELHDRVSRLAGALQRLGISKDDRVAYLGRNSDYFHEFYLGTFWADAVVNPVNTRWSAKEIAYSLDDSSTRVIMADETIRPHLDEIRALYPHVRALIWTGSEPAPAGAILYEDVLDGATPVADARRGGESLAGLFYTGGTTGFPKGVMLSHANLFVGALGSCIGRFVTPGAIFLHTAPMFHLADFGAWAITTLTGGVHVSAPSFEPEQVFEAIRRHNVTHTLLVPAMLQMLVDSPLRPHADMRSLRQISYGGSTITQAVLERAQDAWPHVAFVQAYGQTELSPVTALLGPRDHVAPAPKTRLRSAGVAAPHSEIRIVDPASGATLPPNEVGEIVSRGGHVMLGYWNRPEETAQAIRDGWLHSGDLGYLDQDGYLFVVDRLKDMVISGGENVFSAEVENALAKHRAVAACAVIGLRDDKWGERVHAVVVLKAGEAATESELRDHARQFVAGYKVPRSMEFVDALPLTSTGKVQKTTLRERYR